MKLLAFFYTITTFIDWIMHEAGKASIRNKDLLCYNKDYIIVNTNLGGLFMLFFTITAYFYALFMWYVFYYIPKKQGVVQDRNVEDLESIRSNSMILLDEENVKTVIRELDYDRKFTKS